MEFPDAGYQEDMDQHHGTSDQRLVYLANGSILLGYRLQGLAQTYRMAESIWHEFHRGLYACHVCRVWLHRSITLPWIATVYRRLLSTIDSMLQCRYHLPHPMDTLST